MAKINPAIRDDLDILLTKINECGKAAKALVLRGMTDHDLKKAAKQKYDWRIGSYAADVILKVVCKIW